MKTLVAFLEEPSAAAMLKVVLPSLLPADFELMILTQSRRDAKVRRVFNDASRKCSLGVWGGAPVQKPSAFLRAFAPLR